MMKYYIPVKPFDEFNQLFEYNLYIENWKEFPTEERCDEEYELYLSIPPSMLGLFPYTDRFIISKEWAGFDYFERYQKHSPAPSHLLPEYTKESEKISSYCKDNNIKEISIPLIVYPYNPHPYVINFTSMTRLIKSDNIKFLNCRKSVYQKYKDIGNYIVVDGRHFKDSSKSTSARNMLFKNVIVKSLQEGLKVINTTMTESPNLKEYLLSKGIPLSVININYSEVKLSYEEMIACFMGAKAVFSVGNAGGISTKLFIQCNLYVHFDPNNPDYKSWIWSDSTFGYGGTSMFNARLQKLDSQFKTSKFTDEDVAGSILWSTVKNLNPPLISESSFIDETKITYI